MIHHAISGGAAALAAAFVFETVCNAEPVSESPGFAMNGLQLFAHDWKEPYIHGIRRGAWDEPRILPHRFREQGSGEQEQAKAGSGLGKFSQERAGNARLQENIRRTCRLRSTAIHLAGVGKSWDVGFGSVPEGWR